MKFADEVATIFDEWLPSRCHRALNPQSIKDAIQTEGVIQNA